MTAIFQQFMRYEFTIRENIGFGQLSSLNDDGAIQQAAEHSGAHAFIQELQEQYSMIVGKFIDMKGIDLSVSSISRSHSSIRSRTYRRGRKSR